MSIAIAELEECRQCEEDLSPRWTNRKKNYVRKLTDYDNIAAWFENSDRVLQFIVNVSLRFSIQENLSSMPARLLDR